MSTKIHAGEIALLIECFKIGMTAKQISEELDWHPQTIREYARTWVKFGLVEQIGCVKNGTSVSKLYKWRLV